MVASSKVCIYSSPLESSMVDLVMLTAHVWAPFSQESQNTQQRSLHNEEKIFHHVKEILEAG
jgi:hypothetical protein